MGSSFDDLPDDRQQAASFDSLPDDRAAVPVNTPETQPASAPTKTLPEILLDKVKALGGGIATRVRDLGGNYDSDRAVRDIADAGSLGLGHDAYGLGARLRAMVTPDENGHHVDPGIAARIAEREYKQRIAQDQSEHPGQSLLFGAIGSLPTYIAAPGRGLLGTMGKTAMIEGARDFNENSDAPTFSQRVIGAEKAGLGSSVVAGALHVPMSALGSVAGRIVGAAEKSATGDVAANAASDLNADNAQRLAALKQKIAAARGQAKASFDADEQARAQQAVQNKEGIANDLESQRAEVRAKAAQEKAALASQKGAFYAQEQARVAQAGENKANIESELEAQRGDAKEKVASSARDQKLADLQGQLAGLDDWEKQKYAAEVGALMGRAGNLQAIDRMTPEFKARFGDIFDRHAQITDEMLEKDPRAVAEAAKAERAKDLLAQIQALGRQAVAGGERTQLATPSDIANPQGIDISTKARAFQPPQEPPDLAGKTIATSPAKIAKAQGLDVRTKPQKYGGPSARDMLEQEFQRGTVRKPGTPLPQAELDREVENRISSAKPGFGALADIARHADIPMTDWTKKITDASPAEVAAMARKLGSVGNALLSAHGRGASAVAATLHILGRNPEVARKLSQILGGEGAPSAPAP